MDVYVTEWSVGRDGCAVKRFLVIDERRRGSKRLPRRSRRGGDDEEVVKKVSEVCREIAEMRDVKGMSWGEIADIFNTSRPAVKNYYIRNCLKKRV